MSTDTLTFRHNPFGMVMPSRNWVAGSGDGYRFGFNGKPTDKELSEGSVYDYGFRIYNSRIGRFLSVDPLSSAYPFYTPYQFAGNMPILAIDIDGQEPETAIDEFGYLTDPVIILINATFGFETYGLLNTKWSNADNFDGATWKKNCYNIAQKAQGIYAITLGEEVLFNPQLADITSLSFWIPLIAHEQTHREQNLLTGVAAFNTFYILGKNYEDDAYENEAYMVLLLKENPMVYDILSSTTLTFEEQKEQLTEIGLTFRLNSIIQPKIDLMQDRIAEINTEVNNLQVELKNNEFAADFDAMRIEEKITALEIEKDNLTQKIGVLHVEKSEVESQLEK